MIRFRIVFLLALVLITVAAFAVESGPGRTASALESAEPAVSSTAPQNSPANGAQSGVDFLAFLNGAHPVSTCSPNTCFEAKMYFHCRLGSCGPIGCVWVFVCDTSDPCNLSSCVCEC
jgi:hypothetical protein